MIFLQWLFSECDSCKVNVMVAKQTSGLLWVRFCEHLEELVFSKTVM